MEPDGWLQLRELFAAAVELEPDQRDEFLDRACDGDAELRREVEALLLHDAGAAADEKETLEAANGQRHPDPVAEAIGAVAVRIAGDSAVAAASPLIGQRIGSILVLEPLGQGGMGEVFVGFDEALQRRVALKAIRTAHYQTTEFRARFLREARILSQLEHPNICGIHEYIEGDDRDFLVLELIDGKNLAECMDQGMDSAARMKVALQVAAVLKAAHGKGVVHRDLKPQNVMVTQAGETKVLDFGLAFSQPAATEGEPGSHPGSHPGSGIGFGPIGASGAVRPDGAPGDEPTLLRTQEGQILGTPVYMSPEQAKGEALTTASDMYSFGLMLQVLFTGRSPYPTDLELLSLLARVAQADTLPVVGVSKDLVALIQRLKSAAPAARPTAVETLERLRWIHEKPRRRLRRLLVAGLLLLAMAGLGKYTFDLKRARDEAATRKVQAEGLLGFMLEDLRTSLEPLGRVDLLDAVGDRAMEYFAQAPEFPLSDEELTRQAQALTQIGDVRVSQFRYDDALRSFEEAYARTATLSRRHPDDSDRIFDRGQAEFWVGNTHLRRGDFVSTRIWFQRYLETCQSLLDRDGNRDDWIREVAYGHHNLAVLALEQGDLDSAADAFQEEVVVLRALLERQPGDDQLKEDLADAYSWLGSANRRRAEFGAATEAFQTSSKLFSELEAKDPQNLRWRFWAALGKVLEARVDAVSGRLSQASRHLADGTASLDELVAADPGNRRWRRVRASARLDLAQLLLHQRRDDEALGLVVQGGEELGDLLAAEPSDRKALQFRIRAWRVEADLWRRQGQAAAAREALTKARDAAESALGDEGPRDPIFLAELAATLVLNGSLQSEQGDLPNARRSWSRVDELLGDTLETSRDLDLMDPWLRARIFLAEGKEKGEAENRLQELLASGYRPLQPWPQGSPVELP